MKNSLNEKCAVFGIWNSDDAARQSFFGLFALQHRGQENSGIATTDGAQIYSHKGSGLVSQIYTEEILGELPGRSAIGHNRYSTSHGTGVEHAQPIIVGDFLAFAHNGNLPNVATLSDFLKTRGKDTETLSDSTLMAHAIGVYMKEDGLSLSDAVVKAYPLFTGAFSCVALSKDTLVAFRDPRGIRPLVMGERNGEIIFASETCALRTTGATFTREILPGELVTVTDKGIESTMITNLDPKFDIFEFVYFARFDSRILDQSVYQVRKNFGIMLAKESPKEVDVVIPVPETAVPSAIGYAQELGVPFEMALVKNRYIHRTFIEPSQVARDEKVKMKLTPLEDIIRGKRVAVVDDSIVRGTTSRQIVKMLFEAGAKEVHFLSASAPVKFPDFYGIDTPDQKNLIASQKTVSEIKDFLGATTLSFLSVDGMVSATGLPRERFSLSAFTGEYPIDIGDKKNEISYEVPEE